MVFGTPHFAWIALGTLFIVVLLSLIASQLRHQRLQRVADPSLYQYLSRSLIPSRRRWRFICYLLGIGLVLVAAGRPQYGERRDLVRQEGLDIIYVVDVSLSMLAEDMKPSRFERTKLEISRNLQDRLTDRVGLVVFSGEAFLFCPLTHDLAAVRQFLDEMQIGIVAKTGTFLSKGIQTAGKAFVEGETKSKAIVLFTDGESTTDDEARATQTAARSLADEGVRLITVGVGTASGKPIPIRNEDGAVSGFKKDNQGQVVVSRLNEALLKEIAELGKGTYIAPGQPISSELSYALKEIETKTFETRLAMNYIERYQPFLIVGLFFLIASLSIPERRREGAMQKTERRVS